MTEDSASTRATARVAGEELTRVARATLHACGLTEQASRTAADVLVAADLRGVESHGVSRMLGVYVDWLTTGHANPAPRVSIVRGRGAVRTVDGDRGLGVATVPPLVDGLVEVAAETGVAMAVMVNSRHLGMAAYHAMRALPATMIGICATAVGPIVVPTFGRESRLGTNPIAVAVPCVTEPHFVFDAATSSVSANRVVVAHRHGLPLAPGWVAAPDGTPVMVPSPAPADYASTALLPLGSTHDGGSHKGYGLAASVEILCSVLGGALPVARQGRNLGNHWLAVLDVAAFTDPDGFRQGMDEYRDWLRATPPAAGHERVLVAGEREWESLVSRRVQGVPLASEVVERLAALCERFGVPPLVTAPT